MSRNIFAHKINEQCKQMTFNVYEYFRKKKLDPNSTEYQQDIPLNKTVAEVTGLSEKSVSRIVQQKKQEQVRQKEWKDDFTKGVAASDDSEQMSEMPVTVKIEVEEDDVSEHEEDLNLMELLEKRKRPQEDPIAVDPKKVKVELAPTQSQESQSQFEVEIESQQSQPQSSQFVGIPEPPALHKCVPQAPQQPVKLPEPEPIVVPEFFMHVVVRNQNEILSILKRQVLLQDPEPELLAFLRFLGAKLLRFPKEKREELQDKITEMVLLQ